MVTLALTEFVWCFYQYPHYYYLLLRPVWLFSSINNPGHHEYVYFIQNIIIINIIAKTHT